MVVGNGVSTPNDGGSGNGVSASNDGGGGDGVSAPNGGGGGGDDVSAPNDTAGGGRSRLTWEIQFGLSLRKILLCMPTCLAVLVPTWWWR